PLPPRRSLRRRPLPHPDLLHLPPYRRRHPHLHPPPRPRRLPLSNPPRHLLLPPRARLALPDAPVALGAKVAPVAEDSEVDLGTHLEPARGIRARAERSSRDEGALVEHVPHVDVHAERPPNLRFCAAVEPELLVGGERRRERSLAGFFAHRCDVAERAVEP